MSSNANAVPNQNYFVIFETPDERYYHFEPELDQKVFDFKIIFSKKYQLDENKIDFKYRNKAISGNDTFKSIEIKKNTIIQTFLDGKGPKYEAEEGEKSEPKEEPGKEESSEISSELQLIISMGFDIEVGRSALARTNNNLERALELILDS